MIYPAITDENRCINCHRCGKVCPVKHVASVGAFYEDAYAGYADTDNEIKSCASGGSKSAMSRGYVKGRGVVYGVQYNDRCEEVLGFKAKSVDELDKNADNLRKIHIGEMYAK